MSDVSSTVALPRSLAYWGKVTKVISSTVILTSLTAFGEDYFQGYYLYAARKIDDSGAAPQGDYIAISASTNAGQLNLVRAPSGNPLVLYDEVLLVHSCLVGSLNLAVVPSDNVKQQSLDEVTTIPAAIKKSLAFTGSVGGARIKFDIKVDDPAGTANAIVYKNGVAVTSNPTGSPIYTVWTNPTSTYVTVTQDIGGLALGDVIGIYAYSSGAPRVCYIRNFTISYDLISLPAVQTVIEKVYFDSVHGVSGTAWPIGTIEVPSNNWTDTQTIARLRNLYTIELIHGKITLTANFSGYRFIGNNFSDPAALELENYLDIAGFTISFCSFKGINIITSVPGGTISYCGAFDEMTNINVTNIEYCYNFRENSYIYAANMLFCSQFTNCGIIQAGDLSACSGFTNCSVIQAVNFFGCQDFMNCTIRGMTTLDILLNVINCILVTNLMSTPNYIFKSYLLGFGAGGMVIDGNGWSGLVSLDFTGGTVTLINITDASIILNINGECDLTVAATCTAGTINVRGDINLTNLSGGTVVNDKTNNAVIHILNEHAHSQQKVAPDLASTIQVTSAAGAWNIGAFSADIIPAGFVANSFDIHGVDIGDISANAEYQVNLYYGVADTLAASVTFSRTNPQTSSRPTPCQTIRFPAGSRVRAKLADSAGGNNCKIKLWYHEYV